MVQQAKKIALNEPGDSVTVVADDTDIFALPLLYYPTLQITISVFMTSPEKDKSLIDIGASAEGCNSIVDNILSIHTLSGCDTLSPYHGIG